MSDNLTELYQETILEHSRRPRNYRVLADGNCVAEGNNPTCGDTFTVFIRMEGDVLSELSFQGAGCAIAMASASMLTETLKRKTKAEAKRIFSEVHNMLTTGSAKRDIGKLGVLVGVHRFPIRVKCALLPWHAAMAAMEGRAEIVSTER